MPGKTDTFTVTDATAVPVSASIPTSEITVGEDPSVETWGTYSFSVMKPGPSDPAITVAGGGKYTFRKGGLRPEFSIGEVAGYVILQTGGGSTTFLKDETGF